MVSIWTLQVRGSGADAAAVLPLANQTGGHRLGVNGLAVDEANSILYGSPPTNKRRRRGLIAE